MKRTSFISILAGLAFAAALLISPASCKKEKNQPEPDPQPDPWATSEITMVTKTEVDQEIQLWFDSSDKPVVDGATETDSETTNDNRLVKKYKLTSETKTITIKGKVTRFSCAGNFLTSLDVSKHKNLKNLVCSSNSALGTLDVSNNKQLTHLDCSACALGTLDLSKNPKLKHLNCFSNSELSGDDSLKMPDVRGIGGGTLHFKANSETKRKLSQAKVKTLKEDLGWEVFFYKDSRWQAYDGED